MGCGQAGLSACESVCLSTCVLTHVLGNHRLPIEHLQQLLASTSTAVIQHLAANETISHTVSLCPKMLCLSSSKTFTILSECTL